MDSPAFILGLKAAEKRRTLLDNPFTNNGPKNSEYPFSAARPQDNAWDWQSGFNQGVRNVGGF